MVCGLDILVWITGMGMMARAAPRPVVELTRMTTRTRKRERSEINIGKCVAKLETWWSYPMYWAAALQRTRMNGPVRLRAEAKEAGERISEELRECVGMILDGERRCVGMANLQVELTGFEWESGGLFPLHWEVVLKETERVSEFVDAETLRQYQDEVCGCGQMPLPDDDANS